MAPEKILVIITGGTIDGCLGEEKIGRSTSSIPDYLRAQGISKECEFQTLCMKDSRSLTNKDRENIMNAIQKSDCTKVIIAHGTFTMVETGKCLKANMAGSTKTVVLTGSMLPLGSADSDAPKNLEFAFSSVRKLASGVYICMNGKVFDPDNAKKNELNGKFEEIA